MLCNYIDNQDIALLYVSLSRYLHKCAKNDFFSLHQSLLIAFFNLLRTTEVERKFWPCMTPSFPLNRPFQVQPVREKLCKNEEKLQINAKISNIRKKRSPKIDCIDRELNKKLILTHTTLKQAEKRRKTCYFDKKTCKNDRKWCKCAKIVKPEVQKVLHWPGIEPGSTAWQAAILPLNHQCCWGKRASFSCINPFRNWFK